MLAPLVYVHLFPGLQAKYYDQGLPNAGTAGWSCTYCVRKEADRTVNSGRGLVPPDVILKYFSTLLTSHTETAKKRCPNLL
jgi:hypothetical protein